MKKGMSVHTPEPWELGYEDINDLVHIRKHDTDIALVCSWAQGSKNDVAEAEANARLIAAAPDLLAACKALVKAIADYQAAEGDACPICDILPAYGHCTGEPDPNLPDMDPWPRCEVLIAQDAIKLAEEGA